MRKCAVKPVYSADPRFSGCAAVFARYAEETFGIGWTEGEDGLILAADETCGAEEYRLSIFPEGARIAASGEKGMHNGLADLLARLGRDGDALSADEACLTDKLLGKVKDLDWFAHIKDEDLSAFCEQTALKDERYRFRNGHEITDNLFIRNGNWSSCFNLFFK